MNNNSSEVFRFNGVPTESPWYNVDFEVSDLKLKLVESPKDIDLSPGDFVHVTKKHVGPYSTGFELEEAPGYIFNSVWFSQFAGNKPVYFGTSTELPKIGKRYHLIRNDNYIIETSFVKFTRIIGNSCICIYTENSIYIVKLI